MKHVRVLERLVVALRHGQDDDLVRLAQIERRRAHQIADVLDQQQAVVGEGELRKRIRDHLRVEMAALSGVDLHRSSAGLAHAIGVARCLLVALDDRDGGSTFHALIVFTSSVVFPDPGLETRFSANTPRSANARRFSARSNRSWQAGPARPGSCAMLKRWRPASSTLPVRLRRSCGKPSPSGYGCARCRPECRCLCSPSRTPRPCASTMTKHRVRGLHMPIFFAGNGRVRKCLPTRERTNGLRHRFALDPGLRIAAATGCAHHASP